MVVFEGVADNLEVTLAGDGETRPALARHNDPHQQLQRRAGATFSTQSLLGLILFVRKMSCRRSQERKNKSPFPASSFWNEETY